MIYIYGNVISRYYFTHTFVIGWRFSQTHELLFLLINNRVWFLRFICVKQTLPCLLTFSLETLRLSRSVGQSVSVIRLRTLWLLPISWKTTLLSFFFFSLADFANKHSARVRIAIHEFVLTTVGHLIVSVKLVIIKVWPPAAAWFKFANQIRLIMILFPLFLELIFSRLTGFYANSNLNLIANLLIDWFNL